MADFRVLVVQRLSVRFAFCIPNRLQEYEWLKRHFLGDVSCSG